jgi:hypothetical protein
MNKEFDEKLQNTFPWLKRTEIQRKEDCQYKRYTTPYERYGFELSDGWFQILYDLSKEIEDRFKQAGKPVDIEILQIKNKWGHLCCYYNTPNHSHSIHAIDGIGGNGIRLYPKSNDGDTLYDDVARIVHKYEREISIHTCEWCGKPGCLRKGTWVYTLCDECYQNYLEKKRN